MANTRKVTGHTANPWEASIADFFSNKNWERQLGGIDPRSGEPTLVGNWYRPAGSVGSVGDIQNNVTLRKGPFPYEPLTVPRVEVEPAAQVNAKLAGGFENFNKYPQSPPVNTTTDPIPTEGKGVVDKVVDALSGAGEAGWDFYKSSVHDPAFDFGLNNGQSIVDAISKGNKKGEGFASKIYNDIYGWAANRGVQDLAKQHQQGFNDVQNKIERFAAGGGLNPVIDIFNQFQRGTHRRSSEMSRAVHDWAADSGLQKLGIKAIDIIKFLRKSGAF